MAGKKSAPMATVIGLSTMTSAVKIPEENTILMRTMPTEGFVDNGSSIPTQSVENFETTTLDYTRK